MNDHDDSVWTWMDGYLVKLPREDVEPQPGPEVPPEVHNTRPINAEVCMEAVRAMSKGGAC